MTFFISILSHFKKNWFKFTSIILIITLIFSFYISINRSKKIEELSYIQKDIATLKILNNEDATNELFNYQLSTIYDFYKKLGYNLSEDKYIKTRQQILEQIQNSYVFVNLLEEYFKNNNIENSNKNTLLENFKKNNTGQYHYKAYMSYKNTLLKDFYFYIINNGLIDIEKEKQLIKEQYQTENETIIEEILTNTIQDKGIDIILNSISNNK